MAKATYKDAGVDLDIYREAMQRLPAHLKATYTPRVMHLREGFAGLFSLDFPTGTQAITADTKGCEGVSSVGGIGGAACGGKVQFTPAASLFRRNYQDPVLVSCTDGVGTKLKVACMVGKHDTVGIDLVAMSINDALCVGAEPLFFLDYIAMPKDDPKLLEEVVRGVAGACRECDAALLGGETAILPDLYAPGDYDLAGFCVGVVERAKVLDGSAMRPGDVVVGLASTGLHSNGFSLARKCVFEIGGHAVTDVIAECGGKTAGELLLEPTRLYTKSVRVVLRPDAFAPSVLAGAIHGIAHITGGGLCENLCRIVPDHLKITIQRGSWKIPPVFSWIQRLGEVDQCEMDQVFNMGLGMVFVVSPESVDAVRTAVEGCGVKTSVIGHVAEGERGVVFDR